MINPECLDPKEVLRHLNSLGYYDITPQQLKDFIHDLTKLIKYEQKQAARACMEMQPSRAPGTPDISVTADSPGTPDPPSECRCICAECSDNLEKSAGESDYESSIESSSTTTTTTTTTYSASNKPHGFRSQIESENTQRYHTSFIRAWNLQGCKDPSSRGRKNVDPVRLYHQYKEFWKKQSIPGEDRHLDLRWDIRNRMVGQEPSPRVCI